MAWSFIQASNQSSSQTSGPPADNQSFEEAQSRFQRRGAQRSTGGSSRRIGLKNELITETNEEDPGERNGEEEWTSGERNGEEEWNEW